MSRQKYRKHKHGRNDSNEEFDARMSNRFGGYNMSDPSERKFGLALNARRSAWQLVFSKVCSIVSGRDVEVKYSRGNAWNWNGKATSPPAWTDGKDIFLDLKKFEKIIKRSLEERDTLGSVKDVQTLKGLTYHELAHIIFTPRNSQKPTSIIKKQQEAVVNHLPLWHCYNVLEDARIETLFSAKYPIASNYFSKTVQEFIIERYDDWKKAKHQGNFVSAGHTESVYNMHILTHGRKFLPLATRKSLRDMFLKRHGVATTEMIDAIVDEYRTLVFPRDSKKAVELVRKLASWLNNLNAQIPESHYKGEADRLIQSSSGEHHHQRESSSDGQVSQREASERVEEEDERRDRKEKSQEQEEGSKESTDSDSSEDSDSSDGSDKGDNKKGLDDPHSVENKSDLEDAMNTVSKQMKKSSESLGNDLRKDAIDTIKAVNTQLGAGNGDSGEGSHFSDTFKVASAPAKVNSKKLGDVLAQLQFDSEPRWEKRLAEGRLNTRAYMESQMDSTPTLDVFDQWQEGEDTTSVEVVILLDQSGSMSWVMDQASEAMWAIKKACDTQSIACTVIGYSDYATVLLSSDEKVHVGNYVSFPTVGGTTVSTAFAKAEQIFRYSENKHKILVTITDGEFYEGDNEVKRLMKAFNELEVFTHLAYLTDTRYARYNTDDYNPQDYIDSGWEFLRTKNLCHHQSATVAVDVSDLLQKMCKYLLGVVQEVSANALV